MPEFIEKRRYRRFEIPAGSVRYKRIIAPILVQHFSKPRPVLNAGIGGLAFLSDEEFHQGERLVIQLAAPNENPLYLHSNLKWQDPIALSSDIIAGLEFMEFGDNKDFNLPETLGVLRRLYARYVKG
ncbi:MAG TPA: hypothetical protein VJ373_07605 [Desulfatiglandales bacterium]|nr:hypothetical protein [Desulfatiglandales bacterium]